MSRTFRNSNKDSKVLNKRTVSYWFDDSYDISTRKADRIKGNAVIEDDERNVLINVLTGKFSQGVPRAYRKMYNNKQKSKMKEELSRKVREERFDEVYCGKYIKNAGYYYF